MFDLSNLEDTWRMQGGQGHQGLTLSSKGTVSAKKLTSVAFRFVHFAVFKFAPILIK